MANTYSEMGRFLQESFNIDKTPVKKNLNESIKKSSKKLLKEDFWNPGKEFIDFTNMMDSEFDESGWNSWNQDERDNFAEQVARQYLTMNPTPTPMFFQDLTDNNMHTYRRAFERLSSFNESLTEDYADARPATTKIRNFIEMGADPADILDELLRFLPDSALVDFADYYGENFLGIGDDWDLDESLKESLNESINDVFIKIYKSSDAISEDAWDFPIEELDYLLEEHPGESFVLKDGRLWEVAE